MFFKNMLHFFLQAKPHTHSTPVSPYYKASVIRSPLGPQALLSEHSRVTGDLQERPCPEATKANKSQIVKLFTAVLPFPMRGCGTKWSWICGTDHTSSGQALASQGIYTCQGHSSGKGRTSSY